MQTENRKDFDLDRLLHPAGAFRTPMDVVNDPDMTDQEKRAILASWASDACAVEAAPELRQPPSTPVVRFDDIMDALKALDGKAANQPHYRKFINRAQLEGILLQRVGPRSAPRLRSESSTHLPPIDYFRGLLHLRARRESRNPLPQTKRHGCPSATFIHDFDLRPFSTSLRIASTRSSSGSC